MNGHSIAECVVLSQTDTGQAAASNPVTAVLYAPLGAACTAEFHALLAAASSEGLVRYAMRPVLMPHCQVSVSTLPGGQQGGFSEIIMCSDAGLILSILEVFL